jgi:hypothetical protein
MRAAPLKPALIVMAAPSRCLGQGELYTIYQDVVLFAIDSPWKLERLERLARARRAVHAGDEKTWREAGLSRRTLNIPFLVPVPRSQWAFLLVTQSRVEVQACTVSYPFFTAGKHVCNVRSIAPGL